MAGTVPPFDARTFAPLPGFRASPAPALAPGDVVASAYQVRTEVVRTETGPVYVAWDLQLHREVALKLAWRDPGAPSLVGEAEWCAQVRAGCAVQIFALAQHHGVPLVVAERAPGGVVRAQLTPGGLTAPRVLERATTAIAGVVAAHDAGLAVGELSGETVAMDPTGRLVFGRMSLSQVPSVGAHGMCLAPEALVGDVSPSDPNAAASIDLYGLGCFIYELATGLAPFASAAPADLRRGHAELALPRLDQARTDLPPELADLVEELCAKDPRARPVSADLVRDQIDVIAQRAAAAAPPLHVLVIDDQPPRAARLRSVVHRAGARAQVSISGARDAVAHMRRDLPDLVFVEAQLGDGGSALEVCVGAQAVPELAGTRLVLVTDRIDDRDRAMIAAMGVRDVLLRDDRLADRVIELVRGTGRARRATARRMISG